MGKQLNVEGSAVYAKDDALLYNVIRNKSGIFRYGKMFDYEIISSNEIDIKDGILQIQGRVYMIYQNDIDALVIPSGQQGYQRHDLVVAEFSKATGKEVISLKVIMGEPAEYDMQDPELIQEDTLGTGNTYQMPLYRIRLDGINVAFVEDMRTYIEDLDVEMSELKKSVSDGKREIAAAITQKKVAADSSDSFAALAEKISKIALGSGNATKADVLSGKTFTNSDGIEYTGTMPNNGAVSKTITPSKSSQSYTISKGYHSGAGKITINPIPSGTVNCNRKGSGITSGNQIIDTGDSSTKKGIFVGVFNGTAYIDGSNNNSSWTTLGTYADNGSSGSFTNSSTSGYLQNQTYRYIRIRFVTWDNGIAGKAFYSVFSAG